MNFIFEIECREEKKKFDAE